MSKVLFRLICFDVEIRQRMDFEALKQIFFIVFDMFMSIMNPCIIFW